MTAEQAPAQQQVVTATPDAVGSSVAMPSSGALEACRRLAGPSAVVANVTRLHGGQHSDTWRVDTQGPALSVVVREYPVGDDAAAGERLVLQILDGLGGLAPKLLDSDLDGRWSARPTSVISLLDGEADIIPSDPDRWAAQLGRALATVHAVPAAALTGLTSIFDHPGAARERLAGPLAAEIRARWPHIVASPEVLTHTDFWSGNVVWRYGKLSGIVDWSGAGRGPRGFDLGWCRLDLVLLFDQRVADVFLDAYETAADEAVGDPALWDRWALARSHDAVTSWAPNYAPLGRPDLDAAELRARHSRWTACLRHGSECSQ